MQKNHKSLKSIIAMVLVLSTIITCGPSTIIANADTSNSGAITKLTTDAEQGTILHAWNWSFNTIKDNVEDIKKAGYSAIQVSPIQPSKDHTFSTKSLWYYLYQPIDFKIGNEQLGDEEEFKAMCDAAHAQGLKIIVDVVSNHTGNNGGDGNTTIAPEVPFQGAGYEDYWHNPLHAVSDWTSRYEVTHGGIELPDLNTSNTNVQVMVRSFLANCLTDGADGFRFDAAKHIELPSPLDDDTVSSNYWPAILEGLTTNGGTTPFVYGEVLQGGPDNIDGYTQIMDVTASNNGNDVRNIVGIGSSASADLSDTNFTNYEDYDVPDDVEASSLVTWVESHDTYANSSEESTAMTDEQIKNGWALIASRADSNPLYFNRPAGRSKLQGNMGEKGNDNWKDPDVVAVNKFHNAMEGKTETITKVSDEVVMIERGTEGIVIVNLGDAITGFNTTTNLADGTYNNCATTGGTFTVADGKITGDFSKGITVLYAGGVTEPKSATPKVSIDKENRSFTGTLDLTLNVENGATTSYSIDGVDKGSFTNGDSITIGGDTTLGKTITVNVSATSTDGMTTSEIYTYAQINPEAKATVYFTRPDGWKIPTAYVYNAFSEVYGKAWPGNGMEKIGENLYKLEIDSFTDSKVIFNDKFYGGFNQSNELEISDNGMKIYDANQNWIDTSEIDKDPNVTSDEVVDGTAKVYFQKPDTDEWNYDDVCVYYYGKSALTWPGEPMKKVEGSTNLYTYTLPEGLEGSNIIFNANGGAIQVPGHNESGLLAPANSSMLYVDGTWKDYVETSTTPEEPSTPDSNQTGNDDEKGVSKTPTVSETIYSSTSTVSGTAGANADIILSVDEITQTTTSAGAKVETISKVEEKEIGSATADNNGNWSVKIATQKKGTVIKVTSIEEGKLEASITVTVKKKSSSNSSSSSSSNSNSSSNGATVSVNGNTTTIKSTDFAAIEKAILNSTTANITINLSSQQIVNKNVFEALMSNPNKIITLVEENATWTFSGADILINGATNLDTSIKPISENAAMINNLVSGKEVVNLSFAYKGILPGKATIHASVDSKYNNKIMYMYSYNLENNRLTLVVQNIVIKDGIATFEITKGSDYVLSEIPVAGAVKEGWNQTSDGSWIFVKDEKNTTGWIKDGTNWYLTDKSGIMQTGWQKDSDGKWYYLNESGAMLTNTSFDGYIIGPNGVWIA